MKKEVKVTHMHLYTKERAELFCGQADFMMFPEYMELIYLEAGNVKVVMRFYETYMEVHRYGEARSHLTMKRNQATKNPIESVYGTFEVELYTHEYERYDHKIHVSYDIHNGSDEKDGYKIVIELAEGTHECN